MNNFFADFFSWKTTYLQRTALGIGLETAGRSAITTTWSARSSTRPEDVCRPYCGRLNSLSSYCGINVHEWKRECIKYEWIGKKWELLESERFDRRHPLAYQLIFKESKESSNSISNFKVYCAILNDECRQSFNWTTILNSTFYEEKKRSIQLSCWAFIEQVLYQLFREYSALHKATHSTTLFIERLRA